MRFPLVALAAVLLAGCGDGEPGGATFARAEPACTTSGGGSISSSGETTSWEETNCPSTGGPAEVVDAGDGRTPALEDVRGCLEDEGLLVQGGVVPDNPDDADAPDGELVVPELAVFVVFYDSVATADERAKGIAADIGGTLTRHDAISVLYSRDPEGSLPGEPDERVETCAA